MNVLLVTWAGGGAVPPMLGVGAELRLRGHTVRCLAPDALQAAIARAGLEFRPLRHGSNTGNLDRLPPAEQRKRVMGVMYDEGYGLDVHEEVARARPDAMLIDFSIQVAQVAAEAEGLPYALVGHAVASLALSNAAGRLDRINAARAREGLSAVASAAESWEPAGAVLMASTPLLDPSPPEGIPGLRYIGPVFEPEDPTEELPAHLLAGDEPLVLIGLSSSYIEGQQELLGRTIEALRGLPVRALGTAGPEVDGAALPSAANVTLLPWLPHNRVLPHAALMITHAGHSSVVRGLSHGVPMLCIPLGRDQPFNAGRVEAIGAGLALPTDAEPPAIAEAVRTLLRDGSYQDAARRAVREIAAMGPGAANGADVVEAIAVRQGRQSSP
jgi:UDP:flavonoid glycosyltransferase YjiC (YdhE family)